MQEHEVSLKAFAALRNAIVHDKYRDGLPIATPHPDVVTAIKAVRDQLRDPPRIATVLEDRGPVQTVGPGVGVWRALRAMTSQDHSQVLVYGDEGYAGLLTTNAVARWVASKVDDAGDLITEEVAVSDVTGFAEGYEVAEFVRRSAPVTAVIDLLRGGVGDGPPVAVVVTRNGKRSERPLGILVVHDLPDLIARIAVSF